MSDRPDMAAFWRRKAIEGPGLPLMPAPCHDCACDFYGEMIESLAAQPEEVQLAVLERWFCHNNPRRSCRGALDALKST